MTCLLLAVLAGVYPEHHIGGHFLQAQLLQKPGCIEEVDTQRKLIEELPSKISEILAEINLIQPWYAATPS